MKVKKSATILQQGPSAYTVRGSHSAFLTWTSGSFTSCNEKRQTHQHSLKFGSMCEKVSSISSKPTDRIHSSLLSLMMIALPHHPSVCAMTNSSNKVALMVSQLIPMPGMYRRQSPPYDRSGSSMPREGYKSCRRIINVLSLLEYSCLCSAHSAGVGENYLHTCRESLALQSWLAILTLTDTMKAGVSLCWYLAGLSCTALCVCLAEQKGLRHVKLTCLQHLASLICC